MKTILSILMFLLAVCVRGEIPTITVGTVNGSTSLASPTYYSLANPLFAFPGVRTASTNLSGTNFYYPIGDTNPGGMMMPMKVAFNINAQAFEVLCCGGYPSMMVYNPPDYSTYGQNLNSAVGEGYTWVRVQFATKASRNIIFYLSGSQGNYIGGVNVQQGDTISTNTLGPRKKLEVLGDSYTEGYSQSDGDSRWLGGFSMQLERMLLNVDVIPAGVGGTGYAWPGAATAGTTNYLGRFWSDVVSNNPDYLLINGGLNDDANGVPTNTFFTAVTNLFALSVANLPNAKIAVCGNFYVTGPGSYSDPSSQDVGFNKWIQLAAANYGLQYVSPIANNWLNVNNYSNYMGSDSIHPTIIGYTVIASNLAAAMPSLFPALTVITNTYNLVANGEIKAGQSTNSSNTNPASATFTASTAGGQAPLNVNFTYTGTNGTSFLWAFGDGGTSTSQNPAYTYNLAGIYTVGLVVNGTVTNVSQNLITVTNIITSPASATFTTSTTGGQVPLNVNFTYTGTNGTSFLWAFGDGGTSTLQNPAYAYNSAGIYTVSLVVNGTVTNASRNLITVTNASVSQPAATTLNVTNYGAVGDAVQFYVNTTSNSVLVTTTNQLSSQCIGDAIEIFLAGAQTYGLNAYNTNAYGNQDLIATITNVVNGTNIYISVVASNTLKGAFATYGHDNRTNFQNAVNAAGTNTIVNIPAGKYLILAGANSTAYGYFGVVLNHGGITINGAGAGNTILLGQGAWTIKNNYPTRGFLFEENPPIINNLPVVLENMTLDGGVQQGNTPVSWVLSNLVDGQGWDETHDAFLVWSANSDNAFVQMTWTNLVFQHWRGEMVKSIDSSTNGNLNIFNCSFIDGDATAINIYPSLNISNCLFSTLFQVAEYYQAYSTNTCYFQNNVCTNILGNEFALNGGKGNNPTFILNKNTFYLSGNGNNGIETTPADNVVISSNTFICNNYANAIVLGASGYQGTFDNSNILITANIVTNPSVFVEIAGGSSTDPNRVESVTVSGNILRNPSTSVNFLVGYGWSTNVYINKNDCSQFIQSSVSLNSDWFSAGIPFALVSTNNLYFTQIDDSAGAINQVNYQYGSRYLVVNSHAAKSAYVLVDTNDSQMPVGAQIMLVNSNSSSSSIAVYLDSAMTEGPISVAAGQAFFAVWTNGAWANISGSPLLVGANPVIQVTPGSLSFGTTLNGTVVTNSFIVSNVGNGPLSGVASVSAPFNILSGGTYNLSSNQSQTVVMTFNPSAAGSYSQSVTLTGASGTNVAVSGTATNVLAPIIQLSPGSMAFGSIMSGTRKTNSFTLKNTGSGTLSGSATVAAPFSILSGGTYNLTASQSQTIKVIFNPGASGSYSQSVIFTGGAGTNATVSGSGTNAASGVMPTVSAVGANVSNLGTNAAVLQIAAGTVQLSASATVKAGDTLAWQWLYGVNGGNPTVYQTGSGTAPASSFTYSANAGGNTYVWTLQVTDTKNGLSAQSQITVFLELLPPTGLQVLP